MKTKIEIITQTRERQGRWVTRRELAKGGVKDTAVANVDGGLRILDGKHFNYGVRRAWGLFRVPFVVYTYSENSPMPLDLSDPKVVHVKDGVDAKTLKPLFNKYLLRVVLPTDGGLKDRFEDIIKYGGFAAVLFTAWKVNEIAKFLGVGA